MDYETFERRLLHLIFRTNAPLTPVHVAYYIDLPIAEARVHLDHMVEQGILELDSDADGHLLYRYPLRPPAEALASPKPPRRNKKRRGAPSPEPMRAASGAPTGQAGPNGPNGPNREIAGRSGASESLALAPVPAETRASRAAFTGGTELELVMVDGRQRYSPAAAAALSLFLPGVGQIYSGRVPQGVGWMLATGMGYLFLIPGLILHICCVVNAAAVPSRVPMVAERLPDPGPR
jgi:hypothetical protein